MATYYAWSPIHHGSGVIKVGEEVTQSNLDISDDDWNYLVSSGSVRTKEYPVPAASVDLLSPTQHRMQELAAINAERYTPDEEPEEEPEKQGRGW